MRFSEPNPTIRHRQSYVALPSNSGIIGSLHSPLDLGKFLKGKLDFNALPSVIHEGTHHWCFLSPVGTALSLLYYRGVGTVVEFADNSEAHEVEIQAGISDLIRYEMASRTMAPIIEGLALFAEFDVAGSSRDVWPIPLTWVFGLFGGQPEDDLEASLDRTPALMAKMRSDELLIERKAKVLLGSADAGRNPYLAGYLTVKWAWHTAASKRPEFANADVFFVFLRNYIFSDPELVRLLLGVSREEFETKFAVRLQHRLLTLRNGLDGLPLKEERPLLDSLENHEWQYGSSCDPGTVGVTDEEVRNGEDVLASSIAQLECLANSKSRNRAVWGTVVDVMSERDAFVLDRCEVNVEIMQNGTFRVNYDPEAQTFFCTGQCAISGPHETSGVGYATMLVSRNLGLPYFAICYKGEVLYAIGRGAPDQKEEAWLRRLALGVERTVWLTDSWETYANEWRDKVRNSQGLPSAGKAKSSTWFDAVLPDFENYVACVYWPLCVPPGLSPELRQRAVKSLKPRGVAGLFPDSRIRLLPLMVGWSLGQCTDRHFQAFISSCNPDDTMLAVLEEVNEYAKSRWGSDLFAIEDEEIKAIAI
ncbi:MAG: hypothetical protein JJU18_04885 [Oceanicaulis sp.]|nr:hypothetical protein [Oceanicaulis sp.]